MRKNHIHKIYWPEHLKGHVITKKFLEQFFGIVKVMAKHLIKRLIKFQLTQVILVFKIMVVIKNNIDKNISINYFF